MENNINKTDFNDFLNTCAVLMDKDNRIEENKLFIDLIWDLSKKKTQEARESLMKKTSLSEKEVVKKIQNTKSYIIRNAGIILNHIFYWHYWYLKNNKKTFFRYNYKGQYINVIKKDEEDWWNELRLTSKEITSANKLLVDLGLVKIHIMKVKKQDVEIPSNCYQLMINELGEYMKNWIEIQKNIYYEKVTKIKIARKKYKLKKKEQKQSTDLSTDSIGLPVTDNPSIFNGSTVKNNDLSTLSTLSTLPKNAGSTVTGSTKENTVTGSTKENTVTGSTKENTVTGCTNKAFNTTLSTYSSITEQKEQDTTSFSSTNFEEKNKVVLEIIKQQISQLSYDTWISPFFSNAILNENILTVQVANNFTKNVLESRHLPVLLVIYKQVFKNPNLNIIINVD